MVILPRRNKFGKRFGFSCFRGVEDARMVAVKLDNISIDGKKIHANQPRFNRKQVREDVGGGAKQPNQVIRDLGPQSRGYLGVDK